RFSRDWSSDVCSSDLIGRGLILYSILTVVAVHGKLSCAIKLRCFASGFERISVVNIRLVAIAEGNHAYPSRTRPLSPPAPMVLRSEERRVGKACRGRS